MGTFSRALLAEMALALSLAGCPAPPAAVDAGNDARLDAASDGSLDALGTDSPDSDVATLCHADRDCDDMTFCNGVERCTPGATGADARGCVTASPASPCMSSQRCDEASDRCETQCGANPDADGDGHRSLTCGGDDCDDADALRFPGRTEVCDTTNHDEDCVSSTFGSTDADADGYVAAQCCNTQPGGSLACGNDCDDAHATVHPTEAEMCDGLDNDCNGTADDGVATHDYYPDCDGDGFGARAIAPVNRCAAPGTPPSCAMPMAGSGWVESRNNDCDDANPRANPAATEVCDGVDNDCNGLTDDGMGMLVTFYRDVDGDGFGNLAMTMRACVPPFGYVADGGDCDDSSLTVNPSAGELCNGIDDDCDGIPDDGASSACSLPHATAICTSGACAVDRCSGTYRNCDMDPVNGCESDVASDTLHCGACGAACATGPHAVVDCISAACALTCDPGFSDCDAMAGTGCEVDTRSDPRNCGACGTVCPRRINASAVCTARVCSAPCDRGYGDCDGNAANGCELRTSDNNANCGGCGIACLVNESCADSACVTPFPIDVTSSEYSDYVADATNNVLTPGVHNFRSITVPAGITVTTTGSGVLDLRATGPIVVAGSIDVSGSDGGSNASGGGSPFGGGGGATANPRARGANGTPGVCALGGAGGRGAPGAGSSMVTGSGCNACVSTVGGAYGGGAGGPICNGGGGGGGFAGGAGGGGRHSTGGAGGSSGGSTGGATAGGDTGGQGGQTTVAIYRGGNGTRYNGACSGGCEGWGGSGGGGGSIGDIAAGDLSVSLPMDQTFVPGSAGGGGSGGCACSTCDSTFANIQAGSGGGGGGGALRLASVTSITIDGTVRADGGRGGDTTGNSLGAGGGGGGSGGVIYVSAPSVQVRGSVSAAGGRGSVSPTSHACDAPGGAGGPGRIRVSALSERCQLQGSWNPPVDPACAVSPTGGVAGQTYIGRYPN